MKTIVTTFATSSFIAAAVAPIMSASLELSTAVVVAYVLGSVGTTVTVLISLLVVGSCQAGEQARPACRTAKRSTAQPPPLPADLERLGQAIS